MSFSLCHFSLCFRSAPFAQKNRNCIASSAVRGNDTWFPLFCCAWNLCVFSHGYRGRLPLNSPVLLKCPPIIDTLKMTGGLSWKFRFFLSFPAKAALQSQHVSGQNRLLKMVKTIKTAEIPVPKPALSKMTEGLPTIYRVLYQGWRETLSFGGKRCLLFPYFYIFRDFWACSRFVASKP